MKTLAFGSLCAGLVVGGSLALTGLGAQAPRAAGVTRTSFGSSAGQPVELFTLRNGGGI